MKWIKKGLIFSPDGSHEWMTSHAALPYAVLLQEDIYRIFFSPRNSQNKSQIGYIDVDVEKNFSIVSVSKVPVMQEGNLGCFDDCGIFVSHIVHHNQKNYLYYGGMSQGKAVDFYTFIGLGVGTHLDSFERYSKAPIMGRTSQDPILCTTPWILREKNLWKMWYASATHWEYGPTLKKPRHYYHIKYAESYDGIQWDALGIVCIDFEVSKQEYAIARPCVIKDSTSYKMWYCYRGGSDSYRIGYAESIDGKKWIRKDDEVGIGISERDWDSEMLCYPYVFQHNDITYMLYNGNSYGKTGFGYAVLEK